MVVENTVEDLLNFLIPLVDGEIDFDDLEAAYEPFDDLSASWSDSLSREGRRGN